MQKRAGISTNDDIRLKNKLSKTPFEEQSESNCSEIDDNEE